MSQSSETNRFVRCKRCQGKAQMFQDGQYPKAGCLEKNCTWTFIVPPEILEEFMEANKYEEAAMVDSPPGGPPVSREGMAHKGNSLMLRKRNVALWSAVLAGVCAGIGYAVGGSGAAALGGAMGGFLGAFWATT